MRSTERERKYEIEPGAPVPTLVGAGPVTGQRDPVEHVLDATYFDTADHRLATAGITLRRRTGGDDAGWHLKLPVSADEREELRLPLRGDPDRVPGEFRRLLTAYRLGRRLRPVGHLKTDRFEYRLVEEDGRVVATMTDDHVTGETGGEVAHLDRWRELEVELSEAAEAALLDDVESALVASGAKASKWPSKVDHLLGHRVERMAKPGKHPDAGAVVLDYLATQFEALRRNDIGVRRDTEDAVHRMRVAARRLRSALRAFRAVMDGSATRDLVRDLRWLGTQLAPARDTEVLEERLVVQLRALPPEDVLGGVHRFLTRHFARQAQEARERALEALDGKRYRALLKDLDRLLGDPPLTKKAKRRARGQLAKALRKEDRRLHRAEEATHGVEEGTELEVALHNVRKKAKRARYAADAARPVLGKRSARWRKRVKKVQRTLGEHQDTVVARRALRQCGVAVFAEGDNPFTYGLLYGRDEARAAKTRRTFQRRWRKLSSP